MPDRSVAPKIVDAIDFELQLKPYEKLVLKNGVEVYTINAGAEDVLQLECVFYAGNWMEEQPLVAATANYLLKSGTTKHNAFRLNEYIDYYGAFLNRACYNETATLTLSTLTKHLPQLLPVVKDILTDAQMPDTELDLYKQTMKQRLQVNLKKSDFVAGRLIDTYLFGEQHPYGRFTREESFDQLDRDTLLKFYKKYYQQGKLILFVAGRLPANLEQLLNDCFGDLQVQPVTVSPITIQPATEKKYRINNDANSVQGSVRLARPFPNRKDPDFTPAQVLNTVFGGFFGSRLMSNIREEKGYTYGIGSYLMNHLQQNAWMISTEAGKDVCEATITEVYKEMQLLREELVDDEELLLVKNYLLGSILGDLDGPFQIIGRWKNVVLHGLEHDYFQKSIQTIKSITPEQLRELANKYLQPKDFYELVVV
ncbi:M16 family metallopeptidase [Terrimonas rubra]|uniref:M16 family metallopeptidase n=1 Tax=Terrimonas rubra TaxID=1035890 RepID=A0ABW5ZZU7_9BACT